MLSLATSVLLATALDNADHVAQGYEKYPISYSLALAVAAIGILGSVIAALFWWGASGRAALHKENFRREMERNQDLRRERDKAQDDVERIRREANQDLVKFLLAGESLARLYEDLRAGKAPKPRNPPP